MNAALQLSSLRRLRQASARHLTGEACDCCGAVLEAEHAHVADLETRRLRCVCTTCERAESTLADGVQRALPRRYLRLPADTISDADWSAFEIPVGTAFLFHNSMLDRVVACYPSPAGAVESLLPADAWERVLRNCAETRTLLPDVEALLMRRTREASNCYIVPIDTCYALAGRIRQRWSGFGGGPEAEMEIHAFFAALHGRCEEVPA